jgi:hypothetical protein
MGQYKVRHQSDRSCMDCRFYDMSVTRDSFGEHIQEECDKGHYDYVSRYSEPCKDFKEKRS